MSDLVGNHIVSFPTRWLIFQVLNNMTKLVFNQSHLQDLKSAIGEVIDVFTEILETPTKSYKDIKTRLEKIVSGIGKNILV